MKYSSKEIAATFFQETGTETKGARTITLFECQCGTTRSQELKKGYVNLLSHIKESHKDWEQIMASKNNQSSIMQFVDKKSSTIFSWLQWIVTKNLPLEIVEDELTRKMTKLESISVTTLRKYLYKVTEAVEDIVKEELPETFGIVFDGWTERSVHYIAVFASYSKEGVSKTPLLAIAPPFNEEDFSAASHKAFIEDVLDLYGKNLSNLSFMVADNCSTNKSIANLLGIPMIGCASHRFNLACTLFLTEYEDQLNAINSLMVELRKLKKAAKLRKVTELEPIKRNVTRWNSTHSMLKRFFELKPFLDENDTEIATLIPSGLDLMKLQGLMKDLELIHPIGLMKDLDLLQPVTLKLQESNCTMLEVRRIFDYLLKKYPIMERYLSSDANIIHSPVFEEGLIKVLDNAPEEKFTQAEKSALYRFKRAGPSATIEATESSTSIVEQALKKRKLNISSYVDMTFIPPTSNIVERLFSKARLVLTDYRKSMSPYTFECIMFLKMNNALWDISLVSKLKMKNKAL
jgi:hypothetical protein